MSKKKSSNLINKNVEKKEENLSESPELQENESTDHHKFVTTTDSYPQPLPDRLKSLVGQTIKLENEDPPYIIELLGHLLGVLDYQTNMASFWFLDTLALQLLRYHRVLDDYYRSVFVSWLAGELKLIQNKKYIRQEFFDKMRKIFSSVEMSIYNGHPLLHWDFINCSQNEITENPINTNFNSIEPSFVLERIIESTYASELRYVLIYAVFVEKVEIHTHYLPELKKPRLIKIDDDQFLPFDIHLKKKLNELFTEEPEKDLKKSKAKKDKKNAIKEFIHTPPEPPTNTPMDEELFK